MNGVTAAIEPQYRAFISYSHADSAVATWLHRALETYHVPTNLVGKETPVGPVPRRLTPIFRDRDELAASGDLSTGLKDAHVQLSQEAGTAELSGLRRTARNTATPERFTLHDYTLPDASDDPCR